jgi:glycosyltransferase involved in cell wall biosynthesis
MRIALLHYSYPPVIGGVEQVMEQHATLFVAAGHEVSVLAGSLSSLEPASPAGLRVERLAALCSADAPGDCDEQAVAAFIDLLRPRLAGQQIVFLHNVLTMPFNLTLTAALWRLAGALPGVRFVAWAHDVAAANPDYTLPVPPWALLHAAHPRIEYVAVSALRRRQLAESMGVAEEHCRVIPNGICPFHRLGLPPAVRARAETGRWLSRDLLLLHPARLLRRKNVELSLAVTAELRAAGRDAALLVTAACDPHQSASAAYAADLRELRERLGLGEHVDFLGDSIPLGDDAVDSLYRIADAVQEGFGLPVLEAALHRIPIFFPDAEPLSALLPSSGFAYPPTASASEIAGLIMRQADASAAIQDRKALWRDYAWPGIYLNFLAPLLAGSHNSHR